MRLVRIAQPFDGDDWVFELKYDGFRALAYIAKGKASLVSRNGHTYKSFAPLCGSIADSVRCRNAILDGEIVCLNSKGHPQFNQLL